MCSARTSAYSLQLCQQRASFCWKSRIAAPRSSCCDAERASAVDDQLLNACRSRSFSSVASGRDISACRSSAAWADDSHVLNASRAVRSRIAVSRRRSPASWSEVDTHELNARRVTDERRLLTAPDSISVRSTAASAAAAHVAKPDDSPRFVKIVSARCITASCTLTSSQLLKALRTPSAKNAAAAERRRRSDSERSKAFSAQVPSARRTPRCWSVRTTARRMPSDCTR